MAAFGITTAACPCFRISLAFRLSRRPRTTDPIRTAASSRQRQCFSIFVCVDESECLSGHDVKRSRQQCRGENLRLSLVQQEETADQLAYSTELPSCTRKTGTSSAQHEYSVRWMEPFPGRANLLYGFMSNSRSRRFWYKSTGIPLHTQLGHDYRKRS